MRATEGLILDMRRPPKDTRETLDKAFLTYVEAKLQQVHQTLQNAVHNRVLAVINKAVEDSDALRQRETGVPSTSGHSSAEVPPPAPARPGTSHALPTTYTPLQVMRRPDRTPQYTPQFEHTTGLPSTPGRHISPDQLDSHVMSFINQ